MFHHLLLVDIRLRIGLSGWHLKLLLEISDHRCPLLELKVLLLDVVLEVYHRMRALVQHLMRDV
jgi:hypothetical protein